MSFDYHSVAGDYQYKALHSGHPIQRFWHRGKLTMIDRLVKVHLKEDARLLEIGCGAGNLLMQATVRGSYPVALDLSMQALTFVRSRLEEKGVTVYCHRQVPPGDGGISLGQALVAQGQAREQMR